MMSAGKNWNKKRLWGWGCFQVLIKVRVNPALSSQNRILVGEKKDSGSQHFSGPMSPTAPQKYNTNTVSRGRPRMWGLDTTTAS